MCRRLIDGSWPSSVNSKTAMPCPVGSITFFHKFFRKSPYRSVWIRLIRNGSVCIRIDPYGPVWTRLFGPNRSKWVHTDPYGSIPVPYGSKSIHTDECGSVRDPYVPEMWIHNGSVWICMYPYGSVWTRLTQPDPNGSIRIYMDLYGFLMDPLQIPLHPLRRPGGGSIFQPPPPPLPITPMDEISCSGQLLTPIWEHIAK